jgi:predicted RND superfamily exporter protein
VSGGGGRGARGRESRGKSWNPGHKIAVWTFRHQGWTWFFLVALLAYSAVLLGGFFPQVLPTLGAEFGFRTALRDEHPVRRAYERYEDDFEMRPKLTVYFSGPGVFGSDFLQKVERFRGKMLRRPEVYQVGSCLQLRDPAAHGTQVRLRTILSSHIVDDPEKLAARLNKPPFSNHWLGFLYDRDKTVFVMILTMTEREDDPIQTQDLMRSLEDDLGAFAVDAGVKVHLNGLFWINQEILRTTFENQERLTLLSLGLIVVLLWSMFGSLLFSVLALLLLTCATVLVFTCMAHLGMAMNGLSGNLPSMILVIGLGDLIHIAARYAGGRHLYGPRGAALRAMTSTFLPNLFTSLTTFGCLIVMAATRLQILSHFAYSVCLGIFLVYLVTIVYGPLLLCWVELESGRGLYFRLQEYLERTFRTRGEALHRDGRVLAAFNLFMVFTLALAFTQRVNSNWFRYFSREQPVSRSLDFLEGRGFPVTALELEIPTDRDAYDLILDQDLARDMRKMTAKLEALDGVEGVFSFFTLGEQIREGWQELRFPPGLAPRWIEARRQALYRQLVGFETHVDYYSLKTRAMRLVVTTRQEDSRSLLLLGRRVLDLARRVPLAGIDSSKIHSAGQMLYWSVIMDYVSKTFFMSLIGSLVVVFLCFLLLTRSVSMAFIALIPNVLPAISMIAAARLLGYDLSENFCLLVSISIGIAVDDTLHFLFHVKEELKKGSSMLEAVTHAFRIAGAPIVMTSVILMAGFSVCLAGTVKPTINTGIFLDISIATALVADLLLLPVLLLRHAAEMEAARPAESPWIVEEVTQVPQVLSVLAELEGDFDSGNADQPVLLPGFIAAYLCAPPPGTEPAFWVVRDPSGRVLGMTGFARFRVFLDCLAPVWVQKLASWVRSFWPGFFRLDLLMFGQPAGLATSDTRLARGLTEADAGAVRRLLVERSLDILEGEGRSALVWKEFCDADRPDWDPVLLPELESYPSVPSVKQDLASLHLSSVEEFRRRLRSGYRRQLDHNLERGRSGGLVMELAQPFAPEVAAWVPLFEAVLERSETRLEELGEEFFRELARDPSYLLNTARVEGQLVGGALCQVVGEDLLFLYVGMDYSCNRELDLYFNLLHSVMALALERGCRRIHWGQTSQDAKGRFGGVAVPYRFYLRFRNPVLDWVVRRVGRLLFPERKQARRRVFKDEASPSAEIAESVFSS